MPSCADEGIVSELRPMIFDTEMGADDWMADEEGPAWGQTRKTQEGGHRVYYCTGANKEEFERFFLQTLNS